MREHFFMESFFKKSTNMDGQIEFGPFCEYVEADQRLAKLLRRYGRPYAAENILGECRSVTAVLVADRPNSFRFHVADANSWTSAAELLSESRPAEASVLFRHARDVWAQILQRFPQAERFVSDVHGIEPDWQYFQTVSNVFDGLQLSEDGPPADERDTVFYHHSNGHSWAWIRNRTKPLEPSKARSPNARMMKNTTGCNWRSYIPSWAS